MVTLALIRLFAWKGKSWDFSPADGIFQLRQISNIFEKLDRSLENCWDLKRMKGLIFFFSRMSWRRTLIKENWSFFQIHVFMPKWLYIYGKPKIYFFSLQASIPRECQVQLRTTSLIYNLRPYYTLTPLFHHNVRPLPFESPLEINIGSILLALSHSNLTKLGRSEAGLNHQQPSHMSGF